MEKLDFTNNAAIWHRVYEHLRDRIINGEIAAGQRLVEAAIAKEIGTSRTPVREALHNMQKEGLIESIPRVGYRVRPVKEEEVVQICRIRGVLETLAASWVIEKEHAALVAELRRNVSTSEESIAKGDFQAFAGMDMQFHEAIARLSGSPHIFEITQLMRQHMLRFRIACFDAEEIVVRALDGHRLILRAIERRDAEEAGRALNYHLDLSLRDILRTAFRECRARKKPRQRTKNKP
jgi:DNA-binding GntR family transcriptional regulator